MKRIILSVIFAASCAHAQFNQPPLDQIKIAADAGDPASQDKLAENFIMHMDMARAETWYRKAAEQGYAHWNRRTLRFAVRTDPFSTSPFFHVT